MSESGRKRIVVVGSCMIDFTSFAQRLPQTGETLHGDKFMTTFGGKGANQCVAAAKLGAECSMVAKVGDDMWADKTKENFQEFGVDIKYITEAPRTLTGVAQIIVGKECGDNQIVVVAGANKKLTPDDVQQASSIISDAEVVICQLETTPEVAIKALELCNGISILNGAPALTCFDPKLLQLPTIFCVNESEATYFSGISVKNVQDAKKAAAQLITMGCNQVIITLGSKGALYLTRDFSEPLCIPASEVHAIDTTGAGDCFIGSLAYLIVEKPELSMFDKIKYACIIASDCCRRRGTQLSFPGPDILEKCARKYSASKCVRRGKEKHCSRHRYSRYLDYRNELKRGYSSRKRHDTDCRHRKDSRDKLRKKRRDSDERHRYSGATCVKTKKRETSSESSGT